VGSIRVCAQNLENYYYNYTQSTRPSYSDAAGFQAKTRKIVNAMLDIDADIYAFCEVEANPIVLQQLADSMNAHAGVSGRYMAVDDGIDYEWYEGIADNQIKSGFI
jgi:predicted extracellular nuclease